ncbi:MAG: mandelate racemase/muconate lactonizing enzyme family protein [Halobacteriales archaeon]
MEITALNSFVHPDGTCFVTVETDEGLYGVGEAGLSFRGPAVAEVIRAFEPDLVGADPSRIEHLWQTMFRGGFFPGGVVQSAAVSAVDIALWDLKGKALGVPVYELLGGRTRERVVCYPHVGGETVDDLIADCEARVDEGWEFVRWGLGDHGDGEEYEPDRAVRDGIERVRAVREACGEDLNICVDVHTRLDPSSAVEFCRGVEEYSPFFIEDPLRSENVAKLRTVREKTAVPIAVGEQFDSKWTFREAIEEDLMDYCRVDLCIAGGLTEATKVADWCETHYIHLAPHNPNGPVSTAAALHLCLSSPMVGVQELPRPTGSEFTDVFPEQVPFEDGHLLPPEEPGLGVEFDESAIEDLPEFEPSGGVGFRRADGAYTNW